MNPIPYGRQDIQDEDIQAVVNVLKSDFLTQGPKVEKFETEFARYVGSKYAVAVSNGTSALHLSSLALEVKKGTKVITTPLSFVATSNCIEYCGGEVEFCDIDPETLCLDINLVEQKIKNSPKGTFSGIIPVNFAGFPVNMEEFRKLADKYNLWIIEDSCHAPGGHFIDSKNQIQKCGNGNFADLAIFSFHPVKHIACGEGGMITTNNEKLYQKLILLRSHGITKEKEKLSEFHGGWFYEMQALGFNYRLPDILCALGITQLKRADQNIKKRKQIANKYITAFKNTKIKLPNSNFIDGHAFHLFIILSEKRDELYQHLRDRDIFSQVHYIPINTMPYYKKKYGNKITPEAQNYYEHCLSLPIYPSLKKDEQNFVIQTIIDFLT